MFRVLRRFGLPAVMALGGCAPVSIVPLEECSERQEMVELPPERDAAGTSLVDTFHSTAGCTITFEVRLLFERSVGPDVHLWDPVSGANYELRVEPEGPLGRLEQGVLPEDGRVTVDTVEGNTSAQLTIFPTPGTGVKGKQTAVVVLD
jgi:hypothetical protein